MSCGSIGCTVGTGAAALVLARVLGLEKAGFATSERRTEGTAFLDVADFLPLEAAVGAKRLVLSGAGSSSQTRLAVTFLGFSLSVLLSAGATFSLPPFLPCTFTSGRLLDLRCSI